LSSRRLALIPLGAITFLLLGPFLWAIVMSFRRSHEIFANPYGPPIPFRLDNYVYALESGFLTNILNSALVVAPALVVVTTITTMAAYVFGRARFAFPGRGLVFVAIFVSMFFPPQVTVLSLFQLAVGYGLYNTLWALILVYPASAIAFNTYLLRAFFAQIPTEIEDAARIDGCGDFALFWRVMFPIATPAIATTLIFNFNGFWNEFLFALTLVTKPELATVPLASFRWVGENFLDVGGLAAGLVISMAPIVVLYVLLSEQFMRGMSAGAVKG
jgi:multiple sugar transport system permease protein/raffinose/stachyose/melibiose transport system permease protein